MKTNGPIADKDTTLYVRTDGAVEVRYSHLDEEDGLQYGYLYDVENDEPMGEPMPLAAFTKFDVFDVVDDPDIIAALSEGEEAWESIEDKRIKSIGKALMSVLVKDDQIVGLWYEIIGTDEANYRVNGAWQPNPGDSDVEDAEENFIAPSKMKEVLDLFDSDPAKLMENLSEYEADDNYLKIVLPDMFHDPYTS